MPGDSCRRCAPVCELGLRFQCLKRRPRLLLFTEPGVGNRSRSRETHGLWIAFAQLNHDIARFSRVAVHGMDPAEPCSGLDVVGIQLKQLLNVFQSRVDLSSADECVSQTAVGCNN